MKMFYFIHTQLMFILESLNLGFSSFVLSKPLPMTKKRKYIQLKQRYLKAEYERKVEKNRRGVRGK